MVYRPRHNGACKMQSWLNLRTVGLRDELILSLRSSARSRFQRSSLTVSEDGLPPHGAVINTGRRRARLSGDKTRVESAVNTISGIDELRSTCRGSSQGFVQIA